MNEDHPLDALTSQASPEERNKANKTYSDQKAIRTLAGDVAEAVRERNASAASIVMAERPSVPAADGAGEGFGKKALLAAGSVLLIALGIGGAYFLYLHSPLAPVAPSAAKPAGVPAIVTPDSQKTIDIGSLNQGALRAAIANAFASQQGTPGSIAQLIPVRKNAESGASMVTATGFLAAYGIALPDLLARSLNDQWMLGEYYSESGGTPFIILTESFFQNAYAGMIAWERGGMADALAPLLGYADRAATAAGTSTSSYFGIAGDFSDGVVKNKDARAFVQPGGTRLFLYSFIDNGTLVIAGDQAALAEIVARFEKKTFIR